jgi:trans-2,3-dihydro-3-hydroxyanthranilate isomerase
VRIFTPSSELPFAGHPNVGTAYVLAQMDRYGDLAEMRFEEKAGLVAVTLPKEPARPWGATIRAPRRLEVGRDIDAESDRRLRLAGRRRRSSRATSRSRLGRPGVHLRRTVVGRGAGARAPNTAAFAEACERYDNAGDRFSLFLYARDGEGTLRARCSRRWLTTEDPPPAAPRRARRAAWRCSTAGRRPVDTLIHQGVEMGRPSRSRSSAIKRGGMVEEVTVGGRWCR